MFGFGKKNQNANAPEEEEWLDPEEAEARQKKKRRKKLLIILFIAAALLGTAAGVFFALRGGESDDFLSLMTFGLFGDSADEQTEEGSEEAGEEEEEIPPPVNFVPAHYVEAYYIVEGEEIPAPVQDEDMVLSEWIEGERLSEYRYSGVKKPGDVALAYSTALTGLEKPFMIVDEFLNETAAPDFAATEGMVLMGRVRPDAKVTTVRVNWAPDSVEVEVAARTKPIEQGPTLTHIEILDMLQTLHPSDLNLSGNSMADYQTYIMNGMVYVGEEPCISVKVYSTQNEGGTNSYEHIYFMSRDGKRIYMLNPETDMVTQIR